MAKIFMQDDCLDPEYYLTIKYSGLKPIEAYHHTITYLREIWEVEAKDYWEREFRWDVTSEPRTFFVKAFVDKELDNKTAVTIEVIMTGTQPSDLSRPGKIEIKMSGVMRTTFGGNSILEDARNPFYKSFIWMYNHFFYRKQRRNYLNVWCKRNLNRLKKRYENLLNIIPEGEEYI